ncbi:DnaT-like ssDNA-binding domain-containing protein [Hafnia paralvei]|uniref:DnaT-like ssDNA-binding domain-containing protein n=1 Tax=Hafnia paralvei TaxID=546367 RepID=UPI0038D0D3D7
MARIRTIKPEFWTDEDMAEVSEAACLLAIGLLNYADDEGYFNANPKLIKAAVFPIREPSVSIPVMLRELSNHGYLSLFSTPDNKHFGLVKNFARHQVVNKPRASKIRELQLVPEDYGNTTGGLPLGMDQGSGNGKEELSLAGAGVRENSPPNPVVANQIIDNRPPSTGGIGLTDKFTMFDGWHPDDDFLLKAAQWGLVLTEPPQETVLAEFITYWKAEGKAFHHVQWEQKFSQSLKHMQARRKPTGDKRDETNRRADGYTGAWRGDAIEESIAAMGKQLREAGHNESEVCRILAGNDGDLFRQVEGEERQSTVIALEPSDFIAHR